MSGKKKLVLIKITRGLLIFISVSNFASHADQADFEINLEVAKEDSEIEKILLKHKWPKKFYKILRKVMTVFNYKV